MKKNRLALYAISAGVVLVSHLSSFAQEKVILSGSRFAYPIVERWISEYAKVNPDLQIRINPRGGPNADSASIIINAHELTPEEVRPGYKVVNIARYVLLPVANEKNSRINTYRENGLNEKTAKKIFFDKYDPFENRADRKVNPKDQELLKDLNVYTREQKACAPTTFAQHYGFEQADIRGKRIGGDDKHLITSILRDTAGITYNVPGYIYDLQTRKVKAGIAVIPLDLNNNGKLDEQENIYNTLDDLLTALEKKKISEIPHGYINLSYPQDLSQSKALGEFVLWILQEGHKYHSEYSFLNLENDVLNKQLSILTNN
jgi:phosphate transport system substrate-binding protein